MGATDEELLRDAIERIAGTDILAELFGTKEGAVLQFDNSEIPPEAREEGEESIEKNESLSNQIRGMSVPQRVKLAMFGNQTARAILIRDPNRLIPFFVLENPRITDNEIVELSRNNQVDDTILRAISNNSQWMKSYQVKFNLVSNSKTPIDVSLKWLKFLRDKDLRFLGRSKNIPQVIAAQARKLMEKKAGE